MHRFLLPGLLLVLSSCTDKNAPSTEKFEQLIKASPAATQPVCPGVQLRIMSNLPGSFPIADFKKPDYDLYRTLNRLGYVNLTQEKKPDPWSFTGRLIDMVVVTPTTKWNAQKNTVCPGVWQAQRVKSFTPPGQMANGMTASTVTVEGEQHYTDWATAPELRKAFIIPNLPLPPTAERKYLLVLKNTGWEVAGAD